MSVHCTNADNEDQGQQQLPMQCKVLSHVTMTLASDTSHVNQDQ